MKKNFTKFSQQIALAVCLLGWLVGGQQSAVASKVYFDAGAVCEAPIASEANKLSLNHERIVNTSIDPVWVICPVHADTASNNDSFGWVTTYFSPSDSSAGDEIRCIWRRLNWLAPGKT